MHINLINRFDYDGDFGTVLKPDNRIVKESKDFSDSKNNSPYINPVIDLL